MLDNLSVLAMALAAVVIAYVVVLLPTTMIVLSRTPIGPRAIWALLSLSPLVVWYLLRGKFYPYAYFIVPAWIVYFIYAWFGNFSPGKDRRSKPGIGLALATAAFILASVYLAHDIYTTRLNIAAYKLAKHYRTWPLDRWGKQFLKLQLPTAFAQSQSYDEAMERAMFPNGRPKEKLLFDAMIFKVLWPDMAQRTDENFQEFEVPGGGRALSALVESDAIDHDEKKNYNSLQIHFDIAKSNLLHVCDGEKGLLAHKPVCIDRLEPDVKAPKFGLNRYGIDFSKFPDLSVSEMYMPDKEDLFYHMNSDNIRDTMITCIPDDPVAGRKKWLDHFSPSCNQIFISQPLNATISVHYRREYLKDWQQIQAKWEALLESLIVIDHT